MRQVRCALYLPHVFWGVFLPAVKMRVPLRCWLKSLLPLKGTSERIEENLVITPCWVCVKTGLKTVYISLHKAMIFIGWRPFETCTSAMVWYHFIFKCMTSLRSSPWIKLVHQEETSSWASFLLYVASNTCLRALSQEPPHCQLRCYVHLEEMFHTHAYWNGIPRSSAS